MIVFLAVCLVVGIVLGYIISTPIAPGLMPYVAIGALAGLDTICGGLRSTLEGRFDTAIMYTGFVFNILFAFGLSYLGDRIGVNVFLVCAFIFGQRIFTNLSVIRRLLLTKWSDAKERKAQARAAESASQSGQAVDRV